MTARATILVIGDELLTGSRVDTNGPWLSDQLLFLGIPTTRRMVVGDDVDEIAQSIQLLAGESDVMIVTGGLGPTADDRTRQGLAKALEIELELNAEALDSIRTWFSRRDMDMPLPNETQAMVPTDTTWIQNSMGTAPGLEADLAGCSIFCLPGPPIELHAMFDAVQSRIAQLAPCNTPIRSKEIHSWGLPESIAGDLIKEHMQGGSACVGVLMSKRGITAKVTSADQVKMQRIEEDIQDRWSPWVYGVDGESMASSLSRLVLDQGLIVSTAESCTGGLLSDALVHETGSSEWYVGGILTYSNAMKASHLNITSERIDTCGAVSKEVAAEMSQGVCEVTGATIGLSTTGIAGPTGGTVEKPVGTVYVGCTIQGKTTVSHFCFSGTRTQIRQRTVQSALQLLRLQLLELKGHVMCWQVGETKRVST